MKMTVLANKSGKVICTYIPREKPGENDPILHIEAGPKQVVHEIDVPADYGRRSAEELHKLVGGILKENLKKKSPKRK